MFAGLLTRLCGLLKIVQAFDFLLGNDDDKRRAHVPKGFDPSGNLDVLWTWRREMV